MACVWRVCGVCVVSVCVVCVWRVPECGHAYVNLCVCAYVCVVCVACVWHMPACGVCLHVDMPM